MYIHLLHVLSGKSFFQNTNNRILPCCIIPFMFFHICLVKINFDISPCLHPPSGYLDNIRFIASADFTDAVRVSSISRSRCISIEISYRVESFWNIIAARSFRVAWNFRKPTVRMSQIIITSAFVWFIAFISESSREYRGRLTRLKLARCINHRLESNKSFI